MKKLLLMVAAFAACSVFAAYVPVTHTWKGGDGTSPNEWNVAANWVDGFVPTNAGDTCVFDIGDGNSATITRTGMPADSLPSISILSGTVTFSSGLNTMPRIEAVSQTKPYNPGNVTNVFHVATGATLITAAQLSSSGDAWYQHCWGVRKTGAGSWQHSAKVGLSDVNRILTVLDIVEGTATGFSQPRVEDIHVHDGATYGTSGVRSVAADDLTKFHIEEGGKVEFNVYNGFNAVAPKGFLGEGDVIIANGRDNNELHVTLSGGPYRFGGRIYSTYTKPASVHIGDRASVADAERHFIIGASDTLAGTNGTGVLTYYPYVSPVWGRGVGEFWSFPIAAQPGAPIPTVDEDGEPITLHAGLDAAGVNAAQVTGSGNWFAWGNTTTITGDQVQVTGTIGSDKGATLVLGNGTAEGDVDLSRFAGLVANGSVTFNNASKQTVANATVNAGGAMTINGPMEFGAFKNGGGTVTIGAPTTFGVIEGGISGFTFNSDFTLLGGVLTSLPDWAGVTLSLYDTLVWGGYQSGLNTYDTSYTTKKPAGIKISADGNHATALVIGSGAEVRVGWVEKSLLPNMTVKDGGRLTIMKSGYWSSNDSAPEAFFDGGVLELNSSVDLYGFDLPHTDTASKLTVRVGAKGMRIECNGSRQNGLNGSLAVTDRLKTESGVGGGKDGGIVYESGMRYLLAAIKSVTGPIVAGDGNLMLFSDSFDDEGRLGLGDFELRGGWLSVARNYALDFKLAATEGSRMRYSGSCLIDFASYNNGNAEAQLKRQVLTIGPAGADSSSLVCADKGTLLVIGCHSVDDALMLGASEGHKVLVNGGVATAADGRVIGPVAYERNYEIGFLKYDAEKGFLPYDGYADDFGEGKVFNVTAGAAVPAGETRKATGLRMELSSTKPGITIGENGVLELGDGTNPALVLINTEQNSRRSSETAFSGTGKIDFGASEGVFAIPWKSHMNFDPTPILATTISGKGGIAYIGSSGSYNNMISVSGANDYTGGTRVDRTEVRASGTSPFGPDPVVVNGGTMYGGAVAFCMAGMSVANDFTINGWGKVPKQNNTAYGALHFCADGVVLTGDVSVGRLARITANDAPANAVSTIEGVVSGGHLQFFWGKDAGKRFVLKGHNTLTGGVEIVQSAVTLAGTNPALGTGEVLIDQGELRFENEDDIVMPNDFRGIGTIVLAGKDVDFTGNPSLDGDNTVVVDLAGCSSTLRHFPPFATITNSAAKAATITFDGGTPKIGADQTLTENVNIVLAGGAVLDLDGVDRTIRRLTVLDGSVVNGTITETKPVQGMLLIVR